MGYRQAPASRRRDVARRVRRFLPDLAGGAIGLEARTLLATITVNTTADPTTATNGVISLREAVATATAASGATTIILPSGTYNLNSTSGEMLLGNSPGQNITIQGSSASNTIINQSADPGNRIFNSDNSFNGGVTVSLTNLTIEGATNVNKLYGGGAIIAGGPGDSMTITNCVFQNNSTSNGSLSIGRAGGAIQYGTGGNLTISNSTFQNNTAGGNGNAASIGGAIAFGSDATANGAGVLTITNSTFTNNQATGTGESPEGGAIDVSVNGTSTITNSTFTGNSAGAAAGQGGAIYFSGYPNGTPNANSNLSISTCTFVGNTASQGGAIFIPESNLSVSGSRFHNNSATTGSAIDNAGVDSSSTTIVTANNNWWGADAFPNSPGTDTVATASRGVTTITNHLSLTLTASPSRIGQGATSTLTTDVVSNTATSTPIAGTALDGLAVTFAPGALGSVNPASSTIVNGVVTTTFTAGSTGGTTSPSVTLDNATDTTQITVLSPPVANGQSNVAVAHDSAGTNITLTGTDPNTPPQSLTYAQATSPTHGSITSFNASTGAVTYKPAAGYHGADSFTFTVNNGTSNSSAATVALNVAVGTPSATAQTLGVAHDSPGTPITLAGTDDDTPALTQTFAVVTSPAHGTLSGTAPNLTYTPSVGYHGSDSFTFTDSNGTNTSAAATVTLTVAVGTPTATAQSDSVAFNTPKAITLAGTDDDNPALTLTFAIVAGQGPSHGSITGFNASTGALSYTPSAGYHGADSFQFTVSNGTNTSGPATVTLTVAVGTPTATAQSDNVAHDSQGQAITLTGTDPDVPAPVMTFAIVAGQGPSHGTLTNFNATTGALTYTPTAGYHGADSFQFTVSNGTNTSAPATVSLTVAVGTPSATAQSASTNQNTAVAVTLAGTDDDNPALPLTFAIVAGQGPSHGSITGFNASTGALTYTPSAGYFGADSFQFTVSNGTNTSTPATVSLTIGQVQSTVSGTVGVNWGTAGTATLLTNGDGLRLLPSGRDSDLPFLGINKLTITLSQSASLAAGDVTVSGVNVANYGPVTISGSGTTYTITLAQPIGSADRVTVTIGNANIATFTRRLDVLPGDFNDDGVVNSLDATGIRNEFLGVGGATTTPFADINGDGVVDINDYTEARKRNGTVLP